MRGTVAYVLPEIDGGGRGRSCAKVRMKVEQCAIRSDLTAGYAFRIVIIVFQ